MPDGRTVGVADFGPADGRAVLWCHGGPGSRLEPSQVAADAAAAGLRLIGIDRPGYGRSTPWPGRSIAGWVPDGVAALDELDVERCAVVGVSTGGAYAFALAAAQPSRVSAVVACCALTDMAWAEGRAMMSAATVTGIWEAGDRDTALAIAADELGEDGSRMFAPRPEQAELPTADLDLLADEQWLAAMSATMPEMFAAGVQGYVDDRLADGVGWITFDVGAVRCPVMVLHGAVDTIVPVAQAVHTASIVPGAQLKVVPELGHLSIITEVVPALTELVPGPS